MKEAIMNGKTALGIEFGSTRIKAILVDEKKQPIASGSHEWENQYVDGIWTYSLDAIYEGLQDCYKSLTEDVQEKYGVKLEKIGALGFSAMMHGYMAFNEKDELLVPFRTWRNTITEEASDRLTDLFQYNIPQRWSIAHLYQAILNGEEHVKDVKFFTTLAGFIHWKLSGKKVLGVGEASGMFPIDTATKQFDKTMIGQFNDLVSDKGYPWKLEEILPGVLMAGEQAGVLTEEGAKLLDPTGTLQPGVPMCPPEGDAGTGMVATNSVKVRTGNVSAGTSIFAMIVLDKNLNKVHRQIDMVTTPDGELVAMVHCNNCSSDINAWISLFYDFAQLIGSDVKKGDLYAILYKNSLKGDKDCGGLMAYNYFSGEHVTGFDQGRPLFVREVKSNFNMANFMRVNLYTALATLKTGLDILLKEEEVKIDAIFGHGGLFTTKGVVQSYLAAAINAPVSVMTTASEGGAWGMAILASYMLQKKDGQSLADYLEAEVYADNKGDVLDPDPADVKGFDDFIEKYVAALPVEKAAVETIQ